MSRRILIVEPDAPGRAMMDRVLAAEGYAPEAVATIDEATADLDKGAFDLAIVDELGERGRPLADVLLLRRRYPALPVIVTGALLPQRVMQELIQLEVRDAICKPFTPAELRDAAARALDRAPSHRVEALEYAAALAAARRAIAAGDPARAAPALIRAQAIEPLDPETIALWALLAEIDGRDGDADRGYRAALALRHEEDTAPPDPHEGLSRLAAYGEARPVRALRADRRGAQAIVVTDPARELRSPDLAAASPAVIVTALGLTGEGPGAIYLRDGEGPRAFAIMTGSIRPESVAAAVTSLALGPIAAGEASGDRLDLARITALLGASPAGAGAP